MPNGSSCVFHIVNVYYRVILCFNEISHYHNHCMFNLRCGKSQVVRTATNCMQLHMYSRSKLCQYSKVCVALWGCLHVLHLYCGLCGGVCMYFTFIVAARDTACSFRIATSANAPFVHSFKQVCVMGRDRELLIVQFCTS